MQFAPLPSSPNAQLTVSFVTTGERANNIPSSIPKEEFDAEEGAFLLLHEAKTLFVGVGDQPSSSALRKAAGATMRRLLKLGRALIAVDLRKTPEHCGIVVESFLLASFQPWEKTPTTKIPETIHLLVPKTNCSSAKTEIERAAILGRATNEARRVANLPPNRCTPESLAGAVETLAKDCGLGFECLDANALRKAGCNGLLAVGSGSDSEPCLLFLRHEGDKSSDVWHALVGKTITFDTGGLCIKPSSSMHEMIWDKAGGTTVLGAMQAIAKLGLRKNIVGVLACAENMPDSKAFRPSDILQMADGTTVEVVDTDAEGRLVLADAIVMAKRMFRLGSMIDIATLTGAVGVALGSAAAGLWSSNQPLQDRLVTAATATDERVWPMPLFPEYEQEMKGSFADLKNCGSKLAGACTAAAFLKHFAKETPWAHLDIGETAYLLTEQPDLAKGATGYGVRLLVNVCERL